MLPLFQIAVLPHSNRPHPDPNAPQGDGTASICAAASGIFTLSVHCESNFPARKMASSLDVGLPDGTGDDEYLAAVSGVLPGVMAEFRPDLVLYDAGGSGRGKREKRGRRGSLSACSSVQCWSP